MAQAYNQFSPLNALAYVQEQGEMGRARGQQNQLAQLASQSYAANTPEQRQQLLTSMAVVNPAAAQSQQQQFQGNEDRQRKLAYGAATYLKGALDTRNPAAIAGAWRSVRPGLINAGIGTEADYAQDWQPDYEQVVHQLLASGSGAGSDAGGVLQSQKIGDDGFIYNTFRDGRMINTGVKADRQAWFRDQPGFEPEIISKDGTTRQIGGAAPPAQGVSVGNGAGAVRMNIEGIPAEQQQRMAQTVSMMQQAGYPEQEVMAFLQSQLPAEVAGAPAANGLAPPVPSRARPSAAQDAAATEAAKIEAQLAAAERVAIAEANAARMKKEAELGASAESDRDVASATRVRDARETLDVLGEAIPLLDTATGSGLGSLRDSGAAFFGQATEGAAANAQLRVLATRLTAKVPRFEGPQSDKDVAEYKAAAGDLANDKLPTATRKAAGSTLLRLSRKAVQQAGQPSGSSAGGAGGRTIVRSGMSNGRRVVQYSDGTIDYGN